MTASQTRSPISVWTACAVALALGLPVLLWGLLEPAAPSLQWFVPVCDAIAVVAMLVVGVLGSLDVLLRESRRSLPVVFIASATVVMWIGHFVLFPGDVPVVSGQRFNQATSTLFLSINLAVPLMLTVALLQPGGSRLLTRPDVAITGVIASGLIIGLLIVGLAVAIGPLIQTVSPTGQFLPADAIVGVAGLIPAAFGLIAFFIGLHGDERIAGGVLAALTFSALNSVELLYLQQRYTPSWYADHVLAMLPFAALLAGQLWLYTVSVVAERRGSSAVAAAAERRRIGLDVAAAMARETDPMPVVDRLLGGVLDAVSADRVTMLRLVPAGFVVERSADRSGVPASLGSLLPLDAVVAGDRHVVREAIETKRPVVIGAYRVEGLDSAERAAHAEIAQSVVMPLVRAGAVDGALVVGRRADRAFEQPDVDQLEELSSIAALLIRNARFLAEVESSSQAKSNFINLAAHELGTPIAVIRGYVEMLGDETLGPISARQREPMDALRSTVDFLAERVDQLLVASRLEAGRSRPPVEVEAETNLTDVVRGGLDRAMRRAKLIGAEIAADVPATAIAVRGNARDLGTILDNLVNNAMTYSHPPARIRVEVVDGEAPEVRVADSGIGIPEWEQERIFDQFYRVDDKQFGYPAGTGLGLYISRRLAESAGASLFVERSSPTDGTVFVLRLQRGRA